MAPGQNLGDSQTKALLANARQDMQTLDDAVAYVRALAHENPEKFALSCLGIGFILGWKMKPW